MDPLSKRIEHAEAELVTAKDLLLESTKNLEAAPDEESLLNEVEELSTKVEKQTASLSALKKAEKALAQRAVNEAPAITADMVKRNSYKEENPGDLMFKHATAKLISHVTKRTVDDVINERYGDVPAVKESYGFITKTAVDPAMTTTTGWAAELVRNDNRGFIESLEDVSVAAALAGLSTSLDFNGAHSVTIPVENELAATPTEPAWVGEAGVIPLTSFGFTSKVLNRFKLAAITTMSQEIVEQSTPAIEALVRNSLRKAYAKVLDQALMSVAPAVANVRPAGMYVGVAKLGGTPGGGDTAVRGDITKLLSAMIAGRVGAKPVLIVNSMDKLGASMMMSALSEYMFRDELSGGSLLGIPVISSNSVPQHTAVLVDAEYFAAAFDAPTFNISDVATITEANADLTPPTQASKVGDDTAPGTAGQVPPKTGGIGVVEPIANTATGKVAEGYTARSLWQTYAVGVRMIAPTSWGVMNAAAVQYIDNTSWS